MILAPRSTDTRCAVTGLRDGVRAVVSRFDARYWPEIDEARTFPQAFVQALTDAGRLSALIPEQYGPTPWARAVATRG